MKKRFILFFLLSGLVLMNACQKEHSQEGGNSPSEGTLQDDGTGNCLPKTVAGAYVVGLALTGTSNYIDVQVNVTKAGTYTIYTDTVNGMYFRVFGTFTTVGLNTIRLNGNGTPVAVGISNFVVTYGASTCTIAVTTVGSLAVFTLDGAPGLCMNATPAGTYTAGTGLDASNTVTIHVTVTTAGAYSIATTLSNGIIFTGSGTLAAGAQTIVLSAAGSTPTTAGTTNIPVSVGSSNCSFPVTVGGVATAATYTVDCATATVQGTYTVGTALDPATNKVVLTVNVATAGTYSIAATANGMTFNASGTFASAGAGQNVTLVGTAASIPTTAGSNTVNLTGGTANCTFPVTVNPSGGGAATFTVNCATANVQGTYTVGTALNPATNKVVLTVNVATAGAYSITATANGMTFTASGTFAAAGAGQNVTLVATAASIPTTAGSNTVNLTGGTANCTFPVTVNPSGGGVATFTVDCSTAFLNGYLTKGVAIAAVNTITIDVNVVTAGTYTITTTPINGITYTASGTFPAAGAATVTLNGSGTPVNSGTFTINVIAGTAPCSFSVDVDPNLGTWTFKVGTTTYSGTIYDAAFDNSNPPGLGFYLAGDDATGNLFEIDFGDANGTFANNETYKCAPPITGNAAGVYYDGVDGTTYAGDPLDPALATNTMIVTVTNHNAATKTMTGTFSGKAILNGGTTLVDITNGSFTVTYP